LCYVRKRGENKKRKCHEIVLHMLPLMTKGEIVGRVKDNGYVFINGTMLYMLHFSLMSLNVLG
jgi:hypothetical protein